MNTPPLPRLPLALLRALLPRAERDEVLADVAMEYEALRAERGDAAARRWLWAQATGSAPALLRWNWWREWTGFEPRANAYRPGGPMFKSWISDARYAARRLRRRPAYTVLAVLTLALGIGGTAAVFGIARPLIFDPLPYANADEVASFWMPGWWNEEEFLHMRNGNHFAGFRAVAAHRPGDVTLRDGDAPARLLPGLQSSWELFDVLGARPVVGRTFQQGDDVQGAEPVAVLSWGLWQEMGGQPSILGRRIALDGVERTVVGVMPRGFWYPDPGVRVWLPQPLNPEGRNGSYQFIGHVAPGQDVDDLAAPLARIVRAVDERFDYQANADKTKDAALTPLRESLLGKMRPAVLATITAMGLILLIACVNVAALMLGQVEGRASELAVRAALGAGRQRIMQQVVIEALLVGVAAGLAGAGLAAAGFRLLAQALPIGAWAESARFDWSMFGAALATAVGAALLVVLVPSFSLWRGSLRGALGAARTGGVHGRGGRLERGLVVAEVALAMLIASGAALLVRSVSNLYAIDPGIDTEGIAVVNLVSRRDMPAVQRRLRSEEMVRALGELPGVQSAASTMRLPLHGGGDSFGITVEGKPDMEQTWTYFRFVSPEYFRTMGIRLKDGRLYTSADMIDSAAVANGAAPDYVVVINEALAKKYFPGENPIGRRIGGGLSVQFRIIGVVEDVSEAALTDEPTPTRYFMPGQVPLFGNMLSLVIRTRRPQDAEAILDDARRTVQRVAPDFAVQGTTTMASVLDRAVGPARQVMSLLALLSGLALVLGAVGIYGVIAHFAARRKRDWAIRVALGLPGRKVVSHIVGQGALLVGAGVVIGAIGTAALARLLATFLFGVSTVDPVAFMTASGALLLVGLAAAFIPARRAGMTDPALVLREQ